jgi:hypothetical protein
MGSRLSDASPGRAAGLPLAVAAVVILVVILVIVYRARRARRTADGSDAGTDRQLDEGSGGQ